MLFIPVATPSRLPQHQSPMWWKPADGAIDPDVTHCKSVDSHRRMSNNRGIISDPEVGLRRPVDYWSEKGVGNRLIHLWQRQKKRSCFYSFSFSFSFFHALLLPVPPPPPPPPSPRDVIHAITPSFRIHSGSGFSLFRRICHQLMAAIRLVDS